MIEKIPKPVARRLAIYYRLLKEYSKLGLSTISSSSMGERLNLKSSQIRKDLSYFGGFGKRGTGYKVMELMKSIERILGIDQAWHILIIGAGKIGMALVNYSGLSQDGFVVKAIVDADKDKIGTLIDTQLVVEDVRKMGQIIQEKKIDIGVLCVPPDVAQKTINEALKCGIKGIINFVPKRLEVPEDVMVEDVQISLSFKALSFRMVHNGK
ncbi:MAG TPA: redox-sensing transcriptional repressor Rex [Thermotogota bacterium]|nr:redox-sensing transcriptional repressor Rex [Thermotogota bacterium]HRW33977.1 redox-sensing transcriptional repressor Rex [Thermotogota bacterium]